MTSEQLNEIRARLASRTSRLAWAVEADGDECVCAQCGESFRLNDECEWEAGDFCNACVHLAAHEGIADVAALLAEVDRLTKALAVSRECGEALVQLARGSNANAIAACEDILRLQRTARGTCSGENGEVCENGQVVDGYCETCEEPRWKPCPVCSPAKVAK